MTNQEKHQKIYELTGIEPQYGYCEGDKNISQYYLVTPAYGKPYYPAEQLWEMLPGTVNSKPESYWHLGFNKERNGNGAEAFYMLRPQIEMMVNIDRSDLLTALLDMVLFCIENGYIKGKDDE